MGLSHATVPSSAGVIGCWMHQIWGWFLCCSSSLSFFHCGHSQETQQNITFLPWTSYAERTMLIQEDKFRGGCKNSTRTGMFLKWVCIGRQGLDGFADRNESSSSPRQFSQHLTTYPLYFDPSSVPVPWLLGLLRCVTSLACHRPRSLTDSSHFSVRSVCWF